ncbi:hypothetical protein SAMN05892883_4390 [Jatrophihabitans sp. GAS493]|uniref:ImmA/IrrE family metallo-endopeptidase n=1 Tax=Jatrophihabitans sp. GAS493 TaxID=1907575 RepID=UPI000BBFEC5F|nr:hypothetical protein [Jatrophihabitans sp. GAS493]SOD75184.1 hypothetical protein SAMN05892883_4390 [Jatrophihabitans sp. GAS493]
MRVRRTTSHPAVSRDLRRSCEQRIRDLGLGVPFDPVALCVIVQQRRGRSLRILPKPADLTGGPCGLWLCTEHEDVVFVDESTSELHQLHILLHEIGHLLCDHSMLTETGDGFAAEFLPDLDPAVVRWTLSRHEYVEEQEREAEMLATLLLADAQCTYQVPAASGPVPAGATATNIVLHALQGRPR